jgi:hypothetical protein
MLVDSTALMKNSRLETWRSFSELQDGKTGLSGENHAV